jgi:hypothetical protein
MLFIQARCKSQYFAGGICTGIQATYRTWRKTPELAVTRRVIQIPPAKYWDLHVVHRNNLAQRGIPDSNILWSNTNTDENIDKKSQSKLIGMKRRSRGYLFSSELQLKECSLRYLMKS